MKFSPSLLIVPLLISVSGCASHVSSGYGYDYGHHGHGHVSVGLHGNSSGAAIAGALIVGGIIGTIIADSKNERANQNVERQSEQPVDSLAKNGSQDELVNGYSIDNSQQAVKTSPGDKLAERNQRDTEYKTALASNQSNIQWYQYGKDGNCYLMGVDKGVTDVVSAVPKKKCEQ